MKLDEAAKRISSTPDKFDLSEVFDREGTYDYLSDKQRIAHYYINGEDLKYLTPELARKKVGKFTGSDGKVWLTRPVEMNNLIFLDSDNIVDVNDAEGTLQKLIKFLKDASERLCVFCLN